MGNDERKCVSGKGVNGSDWRGSMADPGLKNFKRFRFLDDSDNTVLISDYSVLDDEIIIDFAVISYGYCGIRYRLFIKMVGSSSWVFSIDTTGYEYLEDEYEGRSLTMPLSRDPLGGIIAQILSKLEMRRSLCKDGIELVPPEVRDLMTQFTIKKSK